jgi:hypothetical protein
MSKSQKARKIPSPVAPEVSVEADGESYRLCFDFGALAVAKQKLKQKGIELNLLRSIDFQGLDVDTLPALFFAAAQKHQPEVSFERAQEIVNLRTAGVIAIGLFTAWKAAMVMPGKNPRSAAREN